MEEVLERNKKRKFNQITRPRNGLEDLKLQLTEANDTIDQLKLKEKKYQKTISELRDEIGRLRGHTVSQLIFPIEILTYIMSFCDITNVKNFALVCKDWNKIFNGETIWKFYAERYFEEKIEEKSSRSWREFVMECYHKPLNLVFYISHYPVKPKRIEKDLKGGDIFLEFVKQVEEYIETVMKPLEVFCEYIKVNGKAISQTNETYQKDGKMFIDGIEELFEFSNIKPKNFISVNILYAQDI